jgi:hypothetical protein
MAPPHISENIVSIMRLSIEVIADRIKHGEMAASALNRLIHSVVGRPIQTKLPMGCRYLRQSTSSFPAGVLCRDGRAR